MSSLPSTAPGSIAPAETQPYRWRGPDRVADAAITAAARDGVKRCQCRHCCKARAERPLVGAAQ